jgi:hypothetical protein
MADQLAVAHLGGNSRAQQVVKELVQSSNIPLPLHIRLPQPQIALGQSPLDHITVMQLYVPRLISIDFNPCMREQLLYQLVRAIGGIKQRRRLDSRGDNVSIQTFHVAPR